MSPLNAPGFLSKCPGLVNIVSARDGGLCRIRLPGGTLSADHADALAAAAAQYASGPIDITNRANLQVRGIRSGCEAAFSLALIQSGLGPGGNDALNLATASSQDEVRNVMISPTAGRDPAALIDTRPIAQSLIAMLMTEPRFTQLSPKFALLLDGGESLAMLTHPHDIWLAAVPAGAAGIYPKDEVQFAFGLAGCPSPLNEPASTATAALGLAPASQITTLVRALLHTFLDLAQPGDKRMRDLLVTHTPDQVLQQAQTYLDVALKPAPNWQRAATDDQLRFGAHQQRDAKLWWIGAQPPVGRLDAATLRRLAQLARHVSASATLQMTPWQGVLIPDVAQHDVPHTIATLTQLGFFCTGQEPLAHIVACAGSTGCARSASDTKADAYTLAQHLRAGYDVHLSGCSRSCAAASPAPYTLLAVAADRYDLYQRSGPDGFGIRIAQRLSVEQAACKIARPAWSPS